MLLKRTIISEKAYSQMSNVVQRRITTEEYNKKTLQGTSISCQVHNIEVASRRSSSVHQLLLQHLRANFLHNVIEREQIRETLCRHPLHKHPRDPLPLLIQLKSLQVRRRVPNCRAHLLQSLVLLQAQRGVRLQTYTIDNRC